MAARARRPRNPLQAGRAQQTRFMLRDALPAEMTPARGTAADGFPQFMVPASLMNENARHSGLKDSTNPAMASSAAPVLYIGRTIPERARVSMATGPRLPPRAAAKVSPII